MIMFNKICVIEGGIKLICIERFIDFYDFGLVVKYVNCKIFMVVLYEVYVDGKLDFKGDFFEILENCY